MQDGVEKSSVEPNKVAHDFNVTKKAIDKAGLGYPPYLHLKPSSRLFHQFPDFS
jgi:hypothetical protein